MSMHPFFETISIAGAIGVVMVAAIILLTLFYRVLALMAHNTLPDPINVWGVLEHGTLATVYVSGQQPFERVRLSGVTTARTKAPVPWELTGMLVLEDEAGTRILVRAKDVRMIVVPPAGERDARGAPPT